MNINNTYSSKASSTKGFSGLASGLDTDSMVEAMLSGTQSKIDKQQGLKQQTQWKQEIYRDIISKLNSFQSKFFGGASSSNLLSRGFYNLMAATSKSSAFRVTATSAAAVGETKIKVKQLATNTRLTSGQAVSGKLQGTFNTAVLQDMAQAELDADRTLVLQVDSTQVAVDLREVFVQDGKFTDLTDAEKADAIATKINDQLTARGLRAQAGVNNGKLTLTTADDKTTIRVEAASDQKALEALGLTPGRSGTLIGGKNQLTSAMSLRSEFSLDVSLDDTQKTLKVNLKDVISYQGNGTAAIDLGKFETQLQQGLDRIHGTNQVKVVTRGNGSFELEVGSGRKIMVGGSANALGAMGMKNGQSNKIGMGGDLKDLYFGTALQGSRYRFSINGVDFSFTDQNNMTEIINRINASDAGVRVVYKSMEDVFVMEATSSGKGFDINLEQTEGNLLSAMFGGSINGTQLKTGGQVTSRQLVQGVLTASDAPAAGDLFGVIKEGTLQLKVNGRTYTLSVPRKTAGEYTKSEIIDSLNHQLDKNFGTGNIQLVEQDGKMAFEVKNGASVEVAASGIDTSDSDLVESGIKSGNLALALGFGRTGQNNLAQGDQTLSQLGLDFGLGDAALEDLSQLSGGTISFQEGRLTFTQLPAQLAQDPAAMERLFGTTQVALNQPVGGNAILEEGKNAIVNIDHVETERSSNNITVNGINIELKEATADYDTADFETIQVTRNTDQVLEGVKSFLQDYNKLIEELNDLIREEATYKNYPPLTAEQKKEMSDREIQLWEEKAKSGLLRRDPAIESFLQAMRTALYSKPAGSSIALYNLGIETSENWQDNGKLVLSADGEARLRQMIESDPDSVIGLFTSEEGGLAVQMNKLLASTANTSSASPGSLVSLAGVKDRASDKNNDLAQRMKQIDDKIATLKRAYDREKSRYWRQFNAMEKAIAQMSSQSSWLTQQMGGGM